MVGVAALAAAPQLGSCASSRRTWRLRAAWHSKGGRGRATAPPLLPPPLLPPPPSRLLELAASKAADSPAFDRAGKLLEEIVTPAPELTGICISPEQDALFVTEASTNVVYRIPL
jgi:hypothetical protein